MSQNKLSLTLHLLRRFIIGTGGETKMREFNIQTIYMAMYELTFDGTGEHMGLCEHDSHTIVFIGVSCLQKDELGPISFCPLHSCFLTTLLPRRP